MTASRRGILAGLSACPVVALLPVVAQASPPQSSRQLTVLLGSATGSHEDSIARDFMAFLQPRLSGIDLVVNNLPGDAGRTMLAALGLATLGLATLGPATPGLAASGAASGNGLTVGWVVTPTLPARMIDRREPSLGQHIRLLGRVEREPVAFVSPPGDPANSIQDIIQRASDDADAVPLGTPPAGSPPHLAALQLQVLAQTQLNIVTFPSADAARQAVLAGNVSAAALGLSWAIGDIRDGTLTALGVAAKRRFGLLPDTPVLDEAGIPLSAFIRRGIAVPADTPPDVVAPLLEAIRAAAQDEAFGEQAGAKGYYAAWAQGPDWLAQMQTEQAALARLWDTNPWLSSSGG